MAERNDDLAYQVLDHIRENPESWNQREYFCGTTACYAGWTLTLDAMNNGEVLEHSGMWNPGMNAAQVLGWTWWEAASVFGNMTRDFSQLERLVKRVLNGEVKDPGLF